MAKSQGNGLQAFNNHKKVAMTTLNTQETPNIKKSKAITSNYPYFEKDGASIIRKVGMSLPAVMKTVIEDEELRAFYSILRDAIVKGGYILAGEDKKVEKAQKKLKELKFRKKLKRITFDALVCKHSFIEHEKNVNGETIAINILDPAYTYPYMDKRGKVLAFYHIPSEVGGATSTQDNTVYDPSTRRSPDVSSDAVKWELDEISHVYVDEISPYFWGYTDVESMQDILLLKKKLVKHLRRLLDQDWFRPHFHGKSVGADDVDAFLEMITLSMSNPDLPITTIGDEDMEAKRFMDESVFLPIIEMLRELRNKILTLIRVPPIIAGTVDNSNRSNSDVQAYFSFNNRVKAIQEDIEDDINDDLLPKLGIEDVEFRFPEVNDRDLMEHLDMAVKMIMQGAKKEVINDWLIDKGYDVPKDMFPTLEEQLAEQDKRMEHMQPANPEGETEGETEGKLDKNSNLHPSRQPQDNFNKNDYGQRNKKEDN